MDMKVILETLVSSVCTSIYLMIAGSGFLNSKCRKSFHNFLIFLVLVLFITINYLFLDNVAKPVISYIVIMFSYMLLFKKNFAQCAVAAIIAYLMILVGEAIFIIILIIFEHINIINNIRDFTGSIFANIFIPLVGILIFYIVKKPFRKLVSKIKDNKKFTLVFTFIMLLIAIGSLFYKLDFNSWKMDSSLFLNISIIISLIYIGIVVIKQYADKARINNEYEEYVRYSKESEKLVERYSISQHENKNELIIIKSMVDKKNIKLLGYLDEIIKSKDNIKKSWIRYLRYIPFGGLKGIIHNKISNMIDSNIDVFLNISKEVQNSNLCQLTMKENEQLCKIIGVFLDNALEAAVVSNKKEISILIYLEEKNTVFEISNTYNGKINIDNIYLAGHSSKGKKRGYGLSLVKTILEENSIFENITELRDNYFVQIVKVQK